MNQAVLSSRNERTRVDGKFFARGNQRLRIKGVTYGPFAPNPAGEQFPAPECVIADFEQMRAAGINSIRAYHEPPAWFLDLADEHHLNLLIDIPWPKHLCFLDRKEAQDQARCSIRQAVERGRNHSSTFAYSIGNEIPTDIVSWHGAQRVQHFLRELMEVAKEADPECLVTYANYPSTEYLDLSFLDFITFNVYLDDPKVFRRYLFRLQNLIGDKPLLLGELGLDTMRHGEEEQANVLGSHLYEATMVGLAGTYVFAWTDDWHTGGFQVEDWAFGLTRLDRSPKLALSKVAEIYQKPAAALLPETPRVSVVVCSYNGGRTLDHCLESLQALDYPDYEIILVDDGSTDGTQEIASHFPNVRTIYQTNLGLSVARNTGFEAATGSIVAYTDSDCYADSGWLAQLVYQLQHSGASAVGGPNLTPDDGWLAACVAAAPGQPTHVLVNDQTAEHVPGCNMAVYREALESINGFSAKYRKAGDDVDMCWRLQHAGRWITFAPGAFVWHHRRQSPLTYLRQQAGYGEAEGLLWSDQPDRFNGWGESKWRGVMYSNSHYGIRIGKPIIHRGVWAAGLFQTLYQPDVAYWTMLPTTLEWHVVAGIVGLMALYWSPLWMVVATMLAMSLLVAGVRAAQATLPPEYRSLRSRLMIAALCYAQPLVRSFWRYRTRLFPPRIPQSDPEMVASTSTRLPPNGRLTVGYWDEQWRDRTELLQQISSYLTVHHWVVKTDSGYNDWCLEVYGHPWTALRLHAAQEDYGSGRRLLRIRYRLHLTGYSRALTGLTAAATAIAVGFYALSAAVVAIALTACLLLAWSRGVSLGSQIAAIVDATAREMRMVHCEIDTRQQEQPPPQSTVLKVASPVRGCNEEL